MIRVAPALPLALFLAPCPAGAESEVEPGASVVIELTRQTSATYSVYSWNRLTPPGRAASQEWAAEFHDGHRHRVETPRDRIVADCAAGTGTYLNLTSGESFGGPGVAKAACGIQASSAILAARREPASQGRFGVVQRVRITDRENIRTYDVAPNGAIVGATIADLSGNILLDSRAVALLHEAAPDIFSEKSLEFSAVADEFRVPPAGSAP